MISRVVLALLILAFSWSQVAAHDEFHYYYDHHHHHDDWEKTDEHIRIGIGVAAGLTLLGAILFYPYPPRPQLLEESQKTAPKIILEGSPTGIRIRF